MRFAGCLALLVILSIPAAANASSIPFITGAAGEVNRLLVVDCGPTPSELSTMAYAGLPTTTEPDVYFQYLSKESGNAADPTPSLLLSTRTASGTYFLSPGTWNEFDRIAIVLNSTNRNVWTAFDLPEPGAGKSWWVNWSIYSDGSSYANLVGGARDSTPLVPNPEPASLLLLGSGLVFGSYQLRKRLAMKKA